MKKRTVGKKWGPILSGGAAGLLNGLFGAGGGMVLVPLLRKTAGLEEREVFATGLAVMLPLSLISAGAAWAAGELDFYRALPYLAGGTLGGAAAGLFFRRLPVLWLRRLFGVLILWGGVRLLLKG